MTKDIIGQTEEVLASIDRLLGEAGSDKTKILSAQIFLPDMGDFAAMNSVWERWVVPGPHAGARHHRGEARQPGLPDRDPGRRRGLTVRRRIAVSRAQFLILALLSVHVLLGGCASRPRAARGTRPACASGGGGSSCTRPASPSRWASCCTRPVANFVGNSLIALLVGAHHPRRAAVHGAAPELARVARSRVAATAVALAAGNFAIAPSVAVNIIAPTVTATAFFAFGIAMLLLHPAQNAGRPARFVALVLATAILVWWVRIVAMPPLLAEPVDRDRLDMVVSSFAIAQILVGVGATFGLFWMEVRLVQCGDGAHGVHGSAHRARQPAGDPRAVRRGGGALVAHGHRLRAGGLRHGPLQGGERRPRAPRGRRAPAPRRPGARRARSAPRTCWAAWAARSSWC